MANYEQSVAGHCPSAEDVARTEFDGLAYHPNRVKHLRMGPTKIVN